MIWDILRKVRDWFGYFTALIVRIWLERPDLWLSVMGTGTGDSYTGIIKVEQADTDDTERVEMEDDTPVEIQQ